MLIALITILFLGGGGSELFDHLDGATDQVKIVVEDRERRKQALATMKEIRSALRTRQRAFGDLSKRLRDAAKAGDVAESDKDDNWYRFFAVNEEFTLKTIELRFQLRDQLSREEWAAIFPAPED